MTDWLPFLCVGVMLCIANLCIKLMEARAEVARLRDELREARLLVSLKNMREQGHD